MTTQHAPTPNNPSTHAATPNSPSTHASAPGHSQAPSFTSDRPDTHESAPNNSSTHTFSPGPNEPKVRAYTPADLDAMVAIWNEVVRDGIAFPQEDELTLETGAAFFAEQTHCAVACVDDVVLGLYILHPNNVGRCGHIANSSYAVSSAARGHGIGRALVEDSLAQGKAHGFRVLQFNAVVESNSGARHLYEKLGFVQLGTIPGGFRMPDGSYANICPYYHEL